MATTIEDGPGSGFSAKVSTSNRLFTDSVTEEKAVLASTNGNAFNFTTDFITIGTGATNTECGIIYIKNNDDRDLEIHHLKMWLGNSGTIAKVRLYKNPTNGTLISSAINGNDEVLNFGSSNEFDGLFYQGDGTALTVTNGSILSNIYLGVGMQQMLHEMYMGQVILPKGTSMAVTVESSISINVSVGINGFYA